MAFPDKLPQEVIDLTLIKNVLVEEEVPVYNTPTKIPNHLREAIGDEVWRILSPTGNGQDEEKIIVQDGTMTAKYDADGNKLN